MVSFCVVKAMLGKGNLSRPLSPADPCPLRTPVPCRPLSSADPCQLDTMLSTYKRPFLGFQCCHWLLSSHQPLLSSQLTSLFQPLETGLVFGVLLLFASAWKCPLCSHLAVTSLPRDQDLAFPLWLFSHLYSLLRREFGLSHSKGYQGDTIGSFCHNWNTALKREHQE